MLAQHFEGFFPLPTCWCQSSQHFGQQMLASNVGSICTDLNAAYCKKYREKNIDKIRKADKERKKFARDYLKYVEEKYEEQKRKDRERKRLANEKN